MASGNNSINMKTKSHNFTIIIPSYTGQEYVAECLDSILSQRGFDDFSFDVVVVIDGPNKELREIIEKQSLKFKQRGISFIVRQFKKNKGRFEARQEGARLSKNEYLLFIDDRNLMADNYLGEVIKAKKYALIPNVLEGNHPNFIAKTMYYVRKKIYGGMWGSDFESYEITSENFEKSSKGTTSLWINRSLFLDACDEINKHQDNLKTMSDDTKLLRYVIDKKVPIYRSSEAKIYYQPRTSAIAELRHIYRRGPMFIDYYLKPGTRFFWPLLLFYVFVLTILFLAFFAPFLLLLLIGLVMLTGLFAVFYTVGFGLTAISVFAGSIVIVASFSLGLLKGIILKIVGYNR